MSAPGSWVGPYRIVRELGRGAMGVVYVGEDSGVGRAVALKLLIGTEQRQLARFEREVEAAGALLHPNIVRVYSAGAHQGTPYYAMELVEGESLADALGRGPLPIAAAEELFADLAAALAYAHEAGVIHRDIKPANVLLGADGRPRLTDFGLARSIHDERERLTRTGQLLGTPATMSPEQISGDKTRVGPPADVWGLGATIFEALTGEQAFQGGNLIELLAAICGGEPSPPRALRPEIPARLESLVLACLRRDPAARPSAGELLACLRGEGAAPRRGGLGALSVGAGSLLLAGVALAAFGTLPRDRDGGTLEPGAAASAPSAAPSPEEEQRPSVRWSQLELTPSPGERGLLSGASRGDPAGGRAFFFGGERGEHDQLQDLWSFEEGRWRELTPRGGSLPKPRRGHTLTFDPVRRTLVLFGGRLTLAPGKPLLNDLWELGPDQRWQQRVVDRETPSPRGWAASVWHPRRARVLVFGGFAARGRVDDLWSWDGREWAREPSRGPSPRQSSALCTWWSRRSAVLFGGGDGKGVLNDLWELGPAGWVRLDPGGRSPPPRRRGGLVEEPGGGLLLFGGYRGTGNPTHDLWRWRPEEGWVELELPAGAPSPRTHAAFMELGGGRYLLYGGLDRRRRHLGETWLLELR